MSIREAAKVFRVSNELSKDLSEIKNCVRDIQGLQSRFDGLFAQIKASQDQDAQEKDDNFVEEMQEKIQYFDD
jgi:hypothetical protein